jgi:hypothetical protein
MGATMTAAGRSARLSAIWRARDVSSSPSNTTAASEIECLGPVHNLVHRRLSAPLIHRRQQGIIKPFSGRNQAFGKVFRSCSRQSSKHLGIDRNRPEETMSPTQTSIPVTRSRSASYNNKALILCPITGYPCEGDLSYLCEDYGCARKGGLSPRSEENL